MSTGNNINDEKLSLIDDRGYMKTNELGTTGTPKTGQINDLKHISISGSSGAFFQNIIPQ